MHGDEVTCHKLQISKLQDGSAILKFVKLTYCNEKSSDFDEIW